MKAGKLSRLMGGGIGPRTETCINWDGTIAMVPCLHQGNVHIPRKLRVWREQKCIPLVGAETRLTCVGQQTTSSHGGRYRSQKLKLRKIGWTDRLGTVFAPRQYLYPKEATGMEKTEMYFTSRCRNLIYLCGPANYLVSWGAV